jgi:hypothetical protein
LRERVRAFGERQHRRRVLLRCRRPNDDLARLGRVARVVASIGRRRRGYSPLVDAMHRADDQAQVLDLSLGVVAVDFLRRLVDLLVCR